MIRRLFGNEELRSEERYVCPCSQYHVRMSNENES